jgi:hypothetical protein
LYSLQRLVQDAFVSWREFKAYRWESGLAAELSNVLKSLQQAYFLKKLDIYCQGSNDLFFEKQQPGAPSVSAQFSASFSW